jgi:hypothetical protein
MWFALQDLLGPTSRIPGWVKMSSRGLEGDCNFAEVSVRYQTDVCEGLPAVCVSRVPTRHSRSKLQRCRPKYQFFLLISPSYQALSAKDTDSREQGSPIYNDVSVLPSGTRTPAVSRESEPLACPTSKISQSVTTSSFCYAVLVLTMSVLMIKEEKMPSTNLLPRPMCCHAAKSGCAGAVSSLIARAYNDKLVDCGPRLM